MGDSLELRPAAPMDRMWHTAGSLSRPGSRLFSSTWHPGFHLALPWLDSEAASSRRDRTVSAGPDGDAGLSSGHGRNVPRLGENLFWVVFVFFLEPWMAVVVSCVF